VPSASVTPIDATPVFRLRVTLLEIEPPIWRRIEVPGHLTLLDLHDVLQLVMGWEDCHLFRFEIDGTGYGVPDLDGDLEDRDADAFQLREILRRKGDRMLYDYDFGDGWEHEIVVEQVSRAAEEPPPPRLLDGARACPPEDVGGPHGYAHFLEVLGDPAHEDHDELIEWAPPGFDPEGWDPGAVRRELAEAASDEPLSPELDALLGDLIEAMGGATEDDPRFPDEILYGAAALLAARLQDEPEAILRARKPEIWAAAALHASTMSFSPYAPGHATLEELAEMWGVSTASVSARSLALREGFGRLEILGELVTEIMADHSDPPGSTPLGE
jgi:hypothetical protein